MRIRLAQTNATVGALVANTDELIAQLQQSDDADPPPTDCFSRVLHCVVYSPEDLLLRPDFHRQVNAQLERLQQATSKTAIAVSYPLYEHGNYYSILSVFQHGREIAHYRKQCLPNYGVFDEQRYFKPGDTSCVFETEWQPHWFIGL